MTSLCLCSVSSCGFRPARPAGNVHALTPNKKNFGETEVTIGLCLSLSLHSDFVPGLSDDSVLLLLNETVGQLAVSANSAVGGASVRLLLLMAGQQEHRVYRLLLRFRGQWSVTAQDAAKCSVQLLCHTFFVTMVNHRYAYKLLLSHLITYLVFATVNTERCTLLVGTFDFEYSVT